MTCATPLLFLKRHGVNLSNGLYAIPDVPSSTSVTYFNGKGVKLYRIGAFWDRTLPGSYPGWCASLGSALDSSMVTAYTTLFDQVASLGGAAIVDLHSYGRYGNGYLPNGAGDIIGGGVVTNAHYADVWSRLATQFKNHTGICAYGLMNEPNNMGGSTRWPLAAQAAIDAIRLIDVTTPILVAGDNYGHAWQWTAINDGLKTLTDPSNLLVYEVHEYGDSPDHGNQDWPTTTPDANVYPPLMDDFKNWLATNGKRGFLGEYSIPVTTTEKRWMPAMTNLLQYLNNNRIGSVYEYAANNDPYDAAGSEVNVTIIAPAGANYTGADAPQMALLTPYVGAPKLLI